MYQEYIDQVVMPLMAGEWLSNRSRYRLKTVKEEQLFTDRPIVEKYLQESRDIFDADSTVKPDLPPFAVEHVRSDGSIFKLVDEQHNGMAYAKVHGELIVWVVERIKYGEA